MNTSSNLLVLGVTGQVGKLVAKNLRRSSAQFSVGTRRKANLEELADQFGASRFIDLDDPRTFDEALKHVTGLFLITGYTVDMLVQSKTLIDAAKRNGVNHIVHLGVFTRERDTYTTVFAWHQMIEAYLRDSGVAWTNLHPNMFMQNLLAGWTVKGGLYSVYTSKPIGFTALEDVAEAAALILMEGPKTHSGKDYWFSADVLQAATRRGLTRFVGRAAELEQLRRAQQLVASGRGQIAAVVGEAGVGKSRLVYEFTHSHRLQGWLTLESASVSYGKATSYLPVIDLLKRYFKIQDRDDLRQIREKVTGKLLTLDRSLEPTLPALLALLDVPADDAAWQALDPAERRRRTLDAVKGLLLREARKQPLLVIFEDLHWIDSETQTLLDGLVESLGSARLLLLVNYRPGYQHTWGSRTYYGQMRLDVLPAESAGELLNGLLGEDPGLGPLKQMLVRRGNPFFLEETVQTLVETDALVGERGRYRLTQPVPTIQVPATVQVILAARIDRLAPEDKHLLQVAAVIGKDVPFALLQVVAELRADALRAGLDHLQAAEFVHEIGLFPDLEYSFKHALTHDVTYGGLLQERRRDLHARVVDALETLHRDRLGEQTERLAHHALHGGLQQKAVDYLRQSGIKSAARSALPAARAWFEQALDVLAKLPEGPSRLEQAFNIRLELRPALVLLNDVRGVLRNLCEAETLAKQLHDDRRQGQVCAFMTSSHTILGELDAALVTGARALGIANRLGDLRLRLLTASYLEVTHWSRGEYVTAVDLARDNLAALPDEWVYETLGTTAPISVYVRSVLVSSLSELGRFAEATQHEADALRLAESTQHAFTLSLAYRAASTRNLREGHWTRARALIEHWSTVAEAGSIILHLPVTITSFAWVLAQLGETRAALDRVREGEELLGAQVANGVVQNVGAGYLALARACLLLGRLDEARRLGARLVERIALQRGLEAHALHLFGDITTHPDRFDAESGEAYYRKALALAEPRGMRPLIAHCHLGLSQLYRRTGTREQAQEHLTAAATMYREMGMTYWLEQAETETQEIG